jgi:hypothetical protein
MEPVLQNDRLRGAGGRFLRRGAAMRSIHLFLIGYCLLGLGVGLALWQMGLLARIAPIWIGIGALVAVGVGIMLSVLSGKPTVSEEIER